MGKRKEQETVIADEQIVELYFRREEGAIRETDKKYGKYHYFSIDIFGLTSPPWIGSLNLEFKHIKRMNTFTNQPFFRSFWH